MEKFIPFFITFSLILFLNEFFEVSSSGYDEVYDVDSVFVFGDSIFDAGNNHYKKNCSAQADFPPYGSSYFHRPTGRFTNGRTVADFISQFIGMGLQRPFEEVQEEIANGSRKTIPADGINFASAGSGVLPETNEIFGVTPIQVQLKQLQTLIDGNYINKKTIQNSLFFLESGSNDIFQYFLYGSSTLTPEACVQAMITEATKFIDQLYKLGARRIAIFSLGPVGCVPARVILPSAPTSRCFGKLNKMVKRYNSGLESLTNDIPKKYPGAVLVYGSVYNIVQLFRVNPKIYGFTNVSDACCGDGTLNGMVQCGKQGYKMCSNPDEFLFWDYFHPSEHTYKLISKALWAGGNKRIRPMNLMTMARRIILP